MGAKYPDFAVSIAIYSFSGTVTRLRRKAAPDLCRAPGRRERELARKQPRQHQGEAGFI